jgi:small-conductance mechanosensitive channel
MLKAFFSELIKIVKSDHPFILLTHDIIDGVIQFWNYKLFKTPDEHYVAVSNVIIGVILFGFGLRFAKSLSKTLRKKLHKNLDDAGLANNLERISYYILILLIAIFVLDISNVPLTALTVVGTTLALGVGLGSQNIANNFISGLIIMAERPIKLGDIIEVKNLNVVGKVTNIGARCVSIRSEDNINILIPNSNILQDTVINWTLDDNDLKTSLAYHVARDADIDKVDELIRKILNESEHILKNPTPHFLIKEITSEGYEYEIEFWINLSQSLDKKYVINEINRKIDPVFKAYNIQIVPREKP